VKTVYEIWKGCISYQNSLNFQEQYKEKAQGRCSLFLMGFECPACITLGLRGSQQEDLIKSVNEYEKQNIKI